MTKLLILLFLLCSLNSFGQQLQNTDSTRKIYFSKLKLISNEFSKYYFPNRSKIYSLSEKNFLKTIDSLKAPFDKELTAYQTIYKTADTKFITAERRDIEYFFDRIILDYPYFHHNYTGKKIKLSTTVQKKLDKHLPDFNNPALLTSSDVKGYIEGFLRHQSSVEVIKPAYKKSDNKRLDAYLNLIPKYFSNQDCKDFWQYHYIKTHLEDWGSKHVESTVRNYLSTSKNENYKKIIDSIYAESISAGKDHLIKTYKTVDGYELDIHLFVPENTNPSKKNPAIIFFSGGSWTEGNPEWAFYSCADYAKRGWVAASVEYRLADRHETTPFEAVKDARSAIRWLRMNAGLYNIDTNRIVASGNSAGGHLVLTTALAKNWDEITDNMNYSASANLLMINTGVYNLYSEDATDWITRDLKDKTLAKRISPIHLLTTGLPPMLIIHGTNDQSVDYSTAKTFVEESRKLGNDVEFHTLEGAPHHIWFDRRYSGKVNTLRKEFLKKYGYE